MSQVFSNATPTSTRSIATKDLADGSAAANLPISSNLSEKGNTTWESSRRIPFLRLVALARPCRQQTWLRYEYARWLLNKSVPEPRQHKTQHLVLTYKALLAPLSIPDLPHPPACTSPPKKNNRVKMLLHNLGIDIHKQTIVGINPGAAYGSAKCWLPERFRSVTEKLLQRSARCRPILRRSRRGSSCPRDLPRPWTPRHQPGGQNVPPRTVGPHPTVQRIPHKRQRPDAYRFSLGNAPCGPFSVPPTTSEPAPIAAERSSINTWSAPMLLPTCPDRLPLHEKN